ncbi:MAG: hypothetical protein HY231_07590 [Acidobacteria bacterium]|nr:hypothetical protein [Acidobacteriota bacterium]
MISRTYLILLVLTIALAGQLALPLISAQARFTLTIYFGKPPDCTNRGLCKITVGRELANPATGAESAARKAAPPRLAEATAELKDHKLYVDFQGAMPDRGETLPVMENLSLDAATARAFASKSITILKGDYKIDYSKNKFGSVVLNLESRN